LDVDPGGDATGSGSGFSRPVSGIDFENGQVPLHGIDRFHRFVARPGLIASNLGHPKMPKDPDVSGPLHEQTVADPKASILSTIHAVDAIF
jgi:hypothetical protein